MSGSISAMQVAYASLALAAVGTGMTVYGQLNQSAAQGSQANYLKKLSDQRQQVGNWQATDAERRGKVAEDAQRAKTAQIIGTQTAALAGQGTDFTGTETDILGDTAAAGKLDELTIGNNAAREAWGYRVGAVNESNNLYGGGSGWLPAAGSLVTGAASLGQKWWMFQQNRTPTPPSYGYM